MGSVRERRKMTKPKGEELAILLNQWKSVAEKEEAISYVMLLVLLVIYFLGTRCAETEYGRCRVDEKKERNGLVFLRKTERERGDRMELEFNNNEPASQKHTDFYCNIFFFFNSTSCLIKLLHLYSVFQI